MRLKTVNPQCKIVSNRPQPSLQPLQPYLHLNLQEKGKFDDSSDLVKIAFPKPWISLHWKRTGRGEGGRCGLRWVRSGSTNHLQQTTTAMATTAASALTVRGPDLHLSLQVKGRFGDRHSDLVKTAMKT